MSRRQCELLSSHVVSFHMPKQYTILSLSDRATESKLCYIFFVNRKKTEKNSWSSARGWSTPSELGINYGMIIWWWEISIPVWKITVWTFSCICWVKLMRTTIFKSCSFLAVIVFEADYCPELLKGVLWKLLIALSVLLWCGKCYTHQSVSSFLCLYNTEKNWFAYLHSVPLVSALTWVARTGNTCLVFWFVDALTFNFGCALS